MEERIIKELNVKVEVDTKITINGYSVEEFNKKIDQLNKLVEELNQKVDSN